MDSLLISPGPPISVAKQCLMFEVDVLSPSMLWYMQLSVLSEKCVSKQCACYATYGMTSDVR